MKPVVKRKISERQIQDAIIHRLRVHGWMVRTISQPRAVYGELSGFPDVIAFKLGHTLLIEVKRSKGKRRPSQTQFFEEIHAHRRLTLMCVLADDVDEFAGFLRTHEACSNIITVEEEL